MEDVNLDGDVGIDGDVITQMLDVIDARRSLAEEALADAALVDAVLADATRLLRLLG